MITARDIGRFLNLTDDGFIVNDTDRSLIIPPWNDLVDSVTAKLLSHPEISSVYLRGSIPRGLAIENVSDADFVYFSETDLSPFENEISTWVERHYPFVKGIELGRETKRSFNQVMKPQTRPYQQMLLKTQALLLGGEDLLAAVLPFAADLNLFSHCLWIKKEYSKLDRDDAKKRKWFSKRLVRSGLELTINRSKQFTRDLYPCYVKFCEFYPNHQEIMRDVLSNALNGHISLQKFAPLVEWIDSEANRIFP